MSRSIPLPGIAEVLGPFLQRVPLDQQPLLIAVAERLAAEFAVVGDTVNVASRLQEVTRTLGTPLVASDAVVAAAGEAPDDAPGLVPLPPQAIRGRSEPIAVWAARVP